MDVIGIMMNASNSILRKIATTYTRPSERSPAACLEFSHQLFGWRYRFIYLCSPSSLRRLFKNDMLCDLSLSDARPLRRVDMKRIRVRIVIQLHGCALCLKMLRDPPTPTQAVLLQGSHVDDEAVLHVALEQALVGLVDLLSPDHFNVRGDVVLGTE